MLNVVSIAQVHALMAHFATQRDNARKARARIAAGVLDQVLADFDTWLLKLDAASKEPHGQD